MNNLIKSNDAENHRDGIVVGFIAALDNVNDGILSEWNSNTISKNRTFGNSNLDIVPWLDSCFGG